MTARRAGKAALTVWIVVTVLAVIHWDFWYWNDAELVFGFLPIGLAYQALFSLACVAVWIAAVRFAWPTGLEEWADEESDGSEADREGEPAQ